MSVRSVSRQGRYRNSFSKILIASFLAGGVSLCSGCHAADKPVVDAASPDPSPVVSASTANSIEQIVQDVFKHARNAVVKIEAVDDRGHLCGTGFFIDPNGTIYTSYSIGGESHDIVVSQGDTKYPATRLIGDSRTGIAILKVEAKTPFIPVAKTGRPEVATPVVAIGYPVDLSLTPSFGIVGGLDWNYLGHPLVTTHIRASVPVQRGEGGAPLLNLKGEVVGIVLVSLDYGAGCYAFPIDAAEKIRTDYVRFGEIRPGWVGIHVNLNDAAVASGAPAVEVNDLLDETPAAKSGLKKGDFLLQIGDRKITTPQDLLEASFFMTAGEEVPITVLRDNAKVTVKVQPMLHPDAPHELPYFNFSSQPLRMQPAH
jgi:serine protease Do